MFKNPFVGCSSIHLQPFKLAQKKMLKKFILGTEAQIKTKPFARSIFSMSYLPRNRNFKSHKKYSRADHGLLSNTVVPYFFGCSPHI